VLAEIPGVAEIPELLVLNKQDLTDDVALRRLQNLHPDAVATSARTGFGTGLLGERVEEFLDAHAIEVRLLLPYDRGDLLAALHREGRVVKTEPVDDGISVTAKISPAVVHRYEAFAG
jgi:GTP-binding protein HflX